MKPEPATSQLLCIGLLAQQKQQLHITNAASSCHDDRLL
jgi:hypothetical protein